MRCTKIVNSRSGRILKLNLANILTLFRIAAIPVVVLCFYSQLPNARPIAAVIFGIAAITDWIDGWVARRYGQTSRFGEFLDPVADKLMVSIVLVMLVQAEARWFEDVIAMIIIGREITISALREWMATIGERANVGVTMAGKVKTTLQMFGIAFMVYHNDMFGIPIYTVGFVLLVLAAIMTIWSMVIYLRAAWPFIVNDQDEANT
jgi:CDP-diacylglycerol--glycerol-3-phosphate 3-phosphatidyltransferase/cardiolipin synthase